MKIKINGNSCIKFIVLSSQLSVHLPRQCV